MLTRRPLLPTFPDVEERQFRIDQDLEGRSYRSEIWIILLCGGAFILAFQSYIVGGDALPSFGGVVFFAAVALPMILRWLAGAQSPVRKWSAQLFIIAVYIDIASLMTVRVLTTRQGIDVIPLVLPIGVLLTLLVVQLRLSILVATLLGGLVVIVTAELWLLDITSNRLFDLVAGSAVVVVPVAAAVGLDRANRQAWKSERDLYRLTRTDTLTGLPNRRALAERMSAVVGAGRGEAMAVAIIDIDFFKRYNDTFGHPAGDACLRRIGAYLDREVIRPGEFVARFAGEEFVVLVGDDDAVDRVEGLRSGIGGLAIPAGDPSRVVTASAGLIRLDGFDDDSPHGVDATLAAADAALYAAKRAGRDRLTVFDGPIDVRAIPERPRAIRRNTDAEPVLHTSWRQLWFDAPLEMLFREQFDEFGRPLRRYIMSGLLAVVVLIFLFQKPLLKIPDEADAIGRFTLVVGITPAVLAGLLGNTLEKLRPWSEAIYVAAVGVVITAQMVERIVQLPRGYDVVPILMPIAVVLSLCVIQIRFAMLLPSMIGYTALIAGLEVAAFPLTVNRVLTVGMLVLMAAVATRFSYRVEKSRRLSWLRSRQLDLISRTDPLTGLPNRREFDSELRSVLMAEKSGGLLILDVDDFKAFNDHFGHLAGDDCLCAVGAGLAAVSKSSHAVVARLGGEEFAAILRGSKSGGGAGVVDAAESICAAIARLGIPTTRPGAVLTASGGLAKWHWDPDHDAVEETADMLMARADEALYAAKRGGRNRMMVAQE
ncbi:GGDEF domain-containing protein [Gordonia sp. TBRC 11910]|uniref:GGDEF domain-containing protein n=1 Tax=Gordonia asplenii TaxID=2725283 RepID=A0A848KQR7_9ACTN|nr:GGDEF domain-containing protein [Gordonia asplenii]NMO00700.1 GGDEF domain-containing protein [Gordonia asplenii]